MNKSEPKIIEKEKIVAEKLNGRFAMLGFIALIGAYLTTGQIIPGFIYKKQNKLRTKFQIKFGSFIFLEIMLCTALIFPIGIG